MDEHAAQPQPSPQAAPAVRPKRHWAGPTIFAVVIIVPALILIFSNTQSTPIDFAWFHWVGPLWVILAITFAAGAIVTRLVMWIWRTYSRRKRKARGDA